MSYITQYLEIGRVDLRRISEIVGTDQVFYNREDHVLTISLGRRDYVIPLHRVRDRLYQEFIPLLNKIHWRQLEIRVIYRNISDERHVMTIGQLYEVLKNLDQAFHIKQYKGLGGMDPKDLRDTCLSKENRISMIVRHPEDMSFITKILGPDSSYRKEILFSNTDGGIGY